MNATPKKGTGQLLTTSGNEDWGTPSAYVELARYVLGSIDLDPASSGYWNHHVVKARTFYDEAVDGLTAPWFGNVFHNPPSNVDKGMRIRPWWDRLISHYTRGEVDAAIWLGFQLGQLNSLQGATHHPLQFVTLFPRERLDFLLRAPNGGPPSPAGAPMHANYVTVLLTRRSPDATRAMLSRFIERANDLEVGGALVRPL